MERIRLTHPQQDILTEQMLYESSSIYNIGALIDIRGNLDYSMLNEVYKHLIQNNDAYHILMNEDLSTFRFQLLVDDLDFQDFSQLDNPAEKAGLFYRERFRLPFNLKENSKLYYFCLIKIDDDNWQLFSVYHHLIVDGWGTSLMFQRLVQIYNSLINKQELPQFNYSYKVFVEDDTKYANSERIVQDRIFWMNQFAELPESFIPLLEKKQAKSSRCQLILSRIKYNSICVEARKIGVTPFHYLLGILYITLYKYFQCGDLTIGLPVLNRSNVNFKKTVGLFMGINLLRMQVCDNLSFAEFLREIRSKLRTIYKHQRYPVGRLIRDLGCLKEPEKLLNVTVSYEKQNYSDDFLNTKTTVRPLSHGQERVALALYIREFDEKSDVTVDFDYNLSFFTEAMVADFVESFRFMIDQTLSAPDISINDLEILTKASINRILSLSLGNEKALSNSDTVVSLFKNAVATNPQKIAVRDGLDSLTYFELDRLSDCIAKRIVGLAKMSANGSPISILMSRSCYLAVAILGSFKSGYPFVPIDPSLPMERMRYIIAHSRSEIILLDNDVVHYEITDQLNAIIVNRDRQDENLEKLNHDLDPSGSAYIIYTSGTTGNPKGVEVGHRSLLNFLISMQVRPGMQKNDLLYSVTTSSFDIFYLELLLPIIIGAELYIAPNEIVANPEVLIDEIVKVKPTIIQSTPSFFQRLVDLGWTGSSNLTILSGGDTLHVKLAQRLLECCQSLWNMYGPTETTIWSMVKKINQPEDVRGLGKPIDNTSLYILSERNEILPLGTVGRIFIGGDGLAKGYYGNDDLTQQKFIYQETLKGRIYDTGDLGRWIGNAEVELLGRNDYQVKIRGFRVEITEIENRLSKISGIDQGIVITKELNGFKQLIAYIVSSELNEQEVKSALKISLPLYMVPERIIFLDSLPKTTNGKVDRNALLGMEFNNDAEPISAMNSLEKKIAKIYEKELGVSVINKEADFFDLGGHSMSVAAVVAQIKSQLGVLVSIRGVYENSSVNDLSLHIESLANGGKLVGSLFFSGKETFPLTESQKNIWYECQKSGRETLYNMSVAFHVEGDLDMEELERSIQEIIEQNDTLNMNFCLIDSVPTQVFKKKKKIKFRNFSGSEFTTVAFNFFQEEFDLEQDLLFRAGIFKDGENCLLLFCTHHLIMDGYSVDLLIDQLAKRSARTSCSNISRSEHFSFRKYLLETSCNDEEQIDAYEYWKGTFQDFHFKHILLPFADREESSMELKNENYQEILEKDFLLMKDLASERRVSLNTLMTLLIAVYINRLTSASEFMIGVAYHGREKEYYTNTLGMFVRTIPIRVLIDEKMDIGSSLESIKHKMMQGYRYSNFPISEKFYTYGLPFEVLVASQKLNSSFTDELQVNGCKWVTEKGVPYHESRTPFAFTIHEHDDQMRISITTGSRYSQRFSDFVSDSFSAFIKDFVQNPNRLIRDFDVFNINKSDYDEDFDFTM